MNRGSIPPSIPPGQSWCDSDDEREDAPSSSMIFAAAAASQSRKRKSRARPTSVHETTMAQLVSMGYRKNSVELVVLESGITEIGAAVEFLTDNPAGRRVRPKRQRVGPPRTHQKTSLAVASNKHVARSSLTSANSTAKKKKTKPSTLTKAGAALKKGKKTPKKPAMSTKSKTKTPATNKKRNASVYKKETVSDASATAKPKKQAGKGRSSAGAAATPAAVGSLSKARVEEKKVTRSGAKKNSPISPEDVFRLAVSEFVNNHSKRDVKTMWRVVTAVVNSF